MHAAHARQANRVETGGMHHYMDADVLCKGICMCLPALPERCLHRHHHHHHHHAPPPAQAKAAERKSELDKAAAELAGLRAQLETAQRGGAAAAEQYKVRHWACLRALRAAWHPSGWVGGVRPRGPPNELSPGC